MRRVSRLLVLLACASILAACSGGSSGPVPTATRSTSGNTTVAAGTVLPADCSRAVLENWLARSSSLVTEFSGVVNGSLATPREQVATILDQLGSLRGAVLAARTPGCAADHRRMVEDMMDKVVSTFTDYSTGQAVDMAAFILDFNNQFNKIKEKETELNALYKNLP